MSWYGHDGAGAVLHQHIVGDPDRNRLAGGRVAAVAAREHTGLRLVTLLTCDQVGAFGFLTVCEDGRTVPVLCNGVHHWVFRRQHHVRRTEDCVRSGRVDLDLHVSLVAFAVENGEVQLSPFAPTDPVALRFPRRVRPVDIRQVVEQPLRVVGDLKEPLGDPALLDRGPASLALSSDHLLVGQHGHARWAPIHRRFFSLGQPCLEELQEEPLRPLVVGRVRGIDGVVPIEHPARTPELAREVLHVRRD